MQKLTILVIEDQTAIAKNIADFFLSKGHTLDFAYTGKQGLSLALNNFYDIILLDLTLPEMDGWEVCKIIREKAERHIADMYFADEKYEEALEHYQYILDEGDNPTLKDYTRSVYIALQELDTPSLGTSFASNAAAAMPENPAALALQGWVLLESGDTVQAKTALRDLVAQYPLAQEPLLYLAKTHEKEEEYETAFDTYKKCYEIEPESAVGMECAQKYEELRITLQNE